MSSNALDVQISTTDNFHKPLSLHEQQDLFNQMDKWLRANPDAPQTTFLRCEIENIYRMQATIVALHNEIAAGDTAIKQLETAVTQLESGNVPVGNNVLTPERVTELLYEVKGERDRFKEMLVVMQRACGNWREWPSGPSGDDHEHPDWKAAARA